MRIPFDLTPDISLPDRHIPTYLALRAAVFVLFLGFGTFVILSTVFPDAKRRFDFRSYGSATNTLSNPRLTGGEPVEDGLVPKAAPMDVNATASGDFSRIVFSFRTEEDTPSGTISAIRAYRAFLAPTGEPMPFRDGSLLRTDTGAFLVSGGSLRAFPDDGTLDAFGIGRERFRPIPEEATRIMRSGEPIRTDGPLPDGMLLRYGDAYYQVRNGAAVPFVSERAYRSRFRDEDAVPVDAGRFHDLGKSGDETIGFLGGTLVSYDEAVYVTEGEGSLLRPIDSPETFLSKGYVWESVVPMTGDEFGIYARGRLYTEQQPHPDGTVFRETGTETAYLLENGMRREIPQEVLPEYASIVPVDAGIVPLGECAVRSGGTHGSCELAWDPGMTGTGAEYQITYRPGEDTVLRDLRVRFVRDMNRRNLDRFVAETVQKIRVRSPFSR